MHAPHLTHLALSSVCVFFTSPEIACTEQPRTQAWQPSHFSGSIVYSISSLQTPPGHTMIFDVRVVLVLEVAEGRKNGIGRRCAEGAQAAVLHDLRDFLEQFHVARRSLCPG